MYRNFLTILLLFFPLSLFAGEYYISSDGNDSRGTGSPERPWKTLAKAISSVPDDGSEIIIKNGLYIGVNNLSRTFTKPVLVRAETPYLARFSSPSDSNRAFYIPKLVNVTFSGLEIFGSGSEKTDYLMQITTKDTYDLRFENCIIHDAYKNDLIKINDHSHKIVFSGCIFFNQTPNPGDEHFDINTVTDITIENSIFFNDYPGSSREFKNGGHSFIVVKNSGSTPDITKNITFRRNIFMNWSGKKDNAFILLGEDGKPFFETQNVVVENNLFLHNTDNPVWGALLFKGGGKNILVRANTFTGHPKTEWFGTFSVVCLNIGKNPKFEKMAFINNIFCDNTGNMPRFSCCDIKCFAGESDFLARNNLYWNGEKNIKHEPHDYFREKNDSSPILGDPKLPNVPKDIILPRFDHESRKFSSGKSSIREEFERLVSLYAIPGKGSSAIEKANTDQFRNMPKDDILGKKRGPKSDLGCYDTGSK